MTAVLLERPAALPAREVFGAAPYEHVVDELAKNLWLFVGHISAAEADRRFEAAHSPSERALDDQFQVHRRGWVTLHRQHRSTCGAGELDGERCGCDRDRAWYLAVADRGAPHAIPVTVGSWVQRRVRVGDLHAPVLVPQHPTNASSAAPEHQAGELVRPGLAITLTDIRDRPSAARLTHISSGRSIHSGDHGFDDELAHAIEAFRDWAYDIAELAADVDWTESPGHLFATHGRRLALAVAHATDRARIRRRRMIGAHG